MRALTIIPGKQHSAALTEVSDPPLSDGDVLVQTLAVGVCGTDLDMLAGLYGQAPVGKEKLIIGHEAMGRVLEAPTTSRWKKGELLVGFVRRPDPVPCSNCAVGEWDMCRNGKFTERGIKERDGFCSETFRIESDFAVKVPDSLEHVGVLVEPTSVVAKAWEQIERIGQRSHWDPQRVLITGAGPIGLLAAMLGVQRGLEVHVLDQRTDGPKPGLVRALGAHYHTGKLADACPGSDIIVECTGVTALVIDAMNNNASDGILCLTGVSTGGREQPIDVGLLNRTMVLENDVVFGSVNANRRHYEAAVEALAKADSDWLGKIISRRIPLAQWKDALERRREDVKPIIDFTL